MSITEEIRTALEVDKLNLPSALKVTSIEVEEYVDSMGEDALRVWVTIDDSVNELKIAGDDVIQLKRAIHDSLLAHGVTYYPYTRIIKPSEKIQDVRD